VDPFEPLPVLGLVPETPNTGAREVIGVDDRDRRREARHVRRPTWRGITSTPTAGRVIHKAEAQARIVEAVNRGGRFTVLYRSRPAFDIVPPADAAMVLREVTTDSLYRAKPVGRSRKGDVAKRHDEVLY